MSVFFGYTVPRITDELLELDDTVTVVVKGHLLVEEHLNRILALQLQRPGELEEARLNFHQRLLLVKALAPADHSIWPLITALNSLRNRLAHSLSREEKSVKVKAFLDQYLALDVDPDTPGAIGQLPEPSAVARAIGFCLGCLARYEEEIAGERA